MRTIQISVLKEQVTSGSLDEHLCKVYGPQVELAALRARLLRLLNTYENEFGGDRAVGLFSGPGRTEIGGNHTDHQHGCVLAAAVDLDAVACAAPNGSSIVRIRSKGYPALEVDLRDSRLHVEERSTSAALVRGVAVRMMEMGYQLGGFDAVVQSTVLGGSGLSSSAAYEVLIGVIFNDFFCQGALNPVQIAQIGQYAENVFFGKPCGLMDQLASSVGGVVSIDFQNPAQPVVKRIAYDLTQSGYELCIIDSGADHADLTDEYAAIPQEMRAVAQYFGADYLRDVDPQQLWRELVQVREKTGDRAVLRAIHFFADNTYAYREAERLEDDDFPGFLEYINRSGQSSAERLQNLYCIAKPQQQAVGITIAVARQLLDGDGAVRVHGGGFAGTVQAFVPKANIERFRIGMEAVLGKGCCHFLKIRPMGGTALI